MLASVHYLVDSLFHSSRLDLIKFLSTTDMPPGVPGVSKNAPASTKLEFGGLVR